MLLAATGLCFAAWSYTLFTVNPFASDTMGFVFFFSSLFLSIMGFAVVINLAIRRIIVRDGNLVLHSAGAIFRQSALIGVAIVTLLLLKITPYSTWWSITLVLVFFGGMEALALSLRKVRRHSDYV